MTESPVPLLNPPRSLWKPIGLALLGSFLLTLSTCGGGFILERDSKSIAGALLFVGLISLGIFLLTLFFAAVYFIIWLIQNAGSK